jgi:hypothetical protein
MLLKAIIVKKDEQKWEKILLFQKYMHKIGFSLPTCHKQRKCLDNYLTTLVLSRESLTLDALVVL